LRRSSQGLPAKKAARSVTRTFFRKGDSDDEYLTPPPKNIGDAFWLKKGTFKAGADRTYDLFHMPFAGHGTCTRTDGL
jgi:hypothetical protein